jgi:hypothetical protein
MKRLLALALVLNCVAGLRPTLAQDGSLANISAEGIQKLYGEGEREGIVTQGLIYLAENPSDRLVNHLVGRSLCDLQRPAEGRPYLEKAMVGNERDWIYGWSLAYLGHAVLLQGDDEAAAAAWRELRDSRLTENAAKMAEGSLCFFALDDEFAEWGRLRSEHFVFAFSPLLAGQDQQAYAVAHEDAYDILTAFFGGGPATAVRYVVWGTEDEARDHCGIKDLGFARPTVSTVHCLWPQTVGHELTHVISCQALRPTSRTGLINEGLAVLFDLTGRDRLATAREAVHAASLTELDLTAWWDDPAGIEQALLYPVAGAWMESLLERGGQANFLALCRDQTLARAREIYGDDLHVWLDEFSRAVVSAL